MSFPRTFESLQWGMCNHCGQTKVPHPRLAGNPDNPWMVCPSEVPGMLLPTLEERIRAPHCKAPSVLEMPFDNGAYYLGHCRNAQIARYNLETNKFTYWREKFGNVYSEEIGHAQNDNGFDLFRPFIKMESLPEGFKEIPIKECCVASCFNCLGERGLWIDRKDPCNTNYGEDVCEDHFNICSICHGEGTISFSLHNWENYEDQCDRTVKCVRCSVLGEKDTSVPGGVFYPVT